jgi:hypothetical protein
MPDLKDIKKDDGPRFLVEHGPRSVAACTEVGGDGFKENTGSGCEICTGGWLFCMVA